jgi:hypothetical protein
MGTLKITVDKTDLSIKGKDMSGRDMILAYLAIERQIEEDSGLPIEMVREAFDNVELQDDNEASEME